VNSIRTYVCKDTLSRDAPLLSPRHSYYRSLGPIRFLFVEDNPCLYRVAIFLRVAEKASRYSFDQAYKRLRSRADRPSAPSAETDYPGRASAPGSEISVADEEVNLGAFSALFPQVAREVFDDGDRAVTASSAAYA